MKRFLQVSGLLLLIALASIAYAIWAAMQWGWEVMVNGEMLQGGGVALALIGLVLAGVVLLICGVIVMAVGIVVPLILLVIFGVLGLVGGLILAPLLLPVLGCIWLVRRLRSASPQASSQAQPVIAP